MKQARVWVAGAGAEGCQGQMTGRDRDAPRLVNAACSSVEVGSASLQGLWLAGRLTFV